MQLRVVVEGDSDKSIVTRLIKEATDHTIVDIRATNGVKKLDANIPKYVSAAANDPDPENGWVIFRDADYFCPVELVQSLLPKSANPRLLKDSHFCLRIVKPSIESWYLADRENFASFFGVSPSIVPRNPDDLTNAKTELLKLCSRSHKRDIRSHMVRSNGKPGDLYVNILQKYADSAWSFSSAAENSGSLHRAVLRLREL